MNDCAKPFPLSKFSKFPHNKKWAFRLRNQAKTQSWRGLRGAPLRGGRKKIKKNPPKNGIIPPWRLTGLYEKAPRKNDVFFLYKGKDWSGWLQSLVGW